MRYIFLLLLSSAMFCNRKPFVNSKIKIEKLADDCKNQQAYFRMVSGFAGERYEFEKCLPDDFKREDMTSYRRGDTVVLRFPLTTGKTVLYKLTVDIDSYPKYGVVVVDDDIYMVIPTKD